MQVKINKRSVYAPIRYEATRPYASPIGRSFMAQFRRGEKARRAFLESLLSLLKIAVSKIGHENGPGPLQAEQVNVQVFGAYQDAGKIIFDVATRLTSSLAMTDAEDIPCGEVPYPCDAFYIHFGKSAGLMLDGYEVEGAFVHHANSHLMIDLVPSGWGQSHFYSLPMGETLVGVSIDMSDPSMSVAEALSRSIDSILEGNARLLAQVAELEARLTAQYGEVVRVPTPVERLDDKEPLLRKALGLILNVLFYLAAEPEDVVTEWSQDVPIEAMNVLRSAKSPGEIRTIENTLIKAGYTKVRMVGRVFAASDTSRQVHDALGAGRSLATHFRRGHFKRQPYGPERALRKTIFVAPVVVNAGKGSEQVGRIYDVR